jgi:predicted transposase/invertase (TIGR01784 family)
MTVIKINPKVDFVFRKLFGSEENIDLLISLLNSILQLVVPIADARIMNPFNLATYQRGKETILDIKAVDENGIWYDIEMQLQPHALYGKRAVYYGAKMFTEQIEQGVEFAALNKTIGIHFLDFDYFEGNDRFVRHFVFKDAETNDRPKELDCLEFYFVEMPKFKKDWSQIKTALDRWIAFLNRASELNRLALPAAMVDDPSITKALSLLERIGLDPKEREIYEGEEKAIMVDQIQIASAEERGEKRGLQQGIEQGMQQGIEQGVRQGRQDGMLEMLLRQMSRLIGEVPAGVASRLSQLSTDDLSELSLAVFDLHSYADVEAWLTRH